MARRLRIQYPAAMYHVMNRGDQREAIFREGVGPTECHISSGAWSRKSVVAGPRAPSLTANRALSRAIPRGQPSGQSVGCSKQGQVTAPGL
jgi:hypothetical protein